MNKSSFVTAARLCFLSYHTGRVNGWVKPDCMKRVDLYRIPNPTEAFIKFQRLGGDRERAFVVFRGTVLSSFGNWLFANLQMHKTRYQAPKFPQNGTVHMGFYRAFYWLWHGDEPETNSVHKRTRRLLFCARHVLIGSIFWRWGFTSQYALWAGVSWFVLVMFELGIVEALFKRCKPLNVGPNLRSQLDRLSACEEVIFTGHSLGGAIAALAFASYRETCGKNSNGTLVTFAAPRIGDEAFVRDFESTHAGKYLHVMNSGDTVPQVPGSFTQALTLFRRGFIIPTILSAIGMVRAIYALMYRQKAPGEWSSPRAHLLGNERLRLVKHHAMESYLTVAESGGIPAALFPIP